MLSEISFCVETIIISIDTVSPRGLDSCELQISNDCVAVSTFFRILLFDWLLPLSFLVLASPGGRCFGADPSLGMGKLYRNEWF
jgi:hypothetical protein